MNYWDFRDNLIEEFATSYKTRYPKADKNILRFIARFSTASGVEEKNVESIRKMFRNGYCYYFALMLKDAFPEGEICWAAPYGHIIFVKENVPYDIEGVYEDESKKFIPISYLGEAINDFRHIDDKEYNISEQEIARIMIEWEEQNRKRGA